MTSVMGIDLKHGPAPGTADSSPKALVGMIDDEAPKPTLSWNVMNTICSCQAVKNKPRSAILVCPISQHRHATLSSRICHVQDNSVRGITLNNEFGTATLHCSYVVRT